MRFLIFISSYPRVQAFVNSSVLKISPERVKFCAMKRIGYCVLLSIGLVVGCATSIGQASAGEEGYHIERETLRKPRPLKVQVLRVDLESPETEVAVVMADDPDGDEPAESVLMAPAELAKMGRLKVAVNAHPWGMIPVAPKEQKPMYDLGGFCDVAGLVVTDGKVRSEQSDASWSLWQDEGRIWHLGTVPSGSQLRQAVSGFGPILEEGQVMVRPCDILHPRTAVGLDKQSRQLIFVVVDGRQPGVSEGMSEYELAEYMKSLGCWNVLNLDGGGSSILVKGANPRILNTPSGGGVARPVPVMIGLRRQNYH